MYLRRKSRFRYVLHTLVHDPKPITTDPMTMYIRWRRSWYDLARCRYVHADQLTFWVRFNQRYLSRSYRYICAHLCQPLVLAHWYHGFSIRCPVFGSNSKRACHSRATDCPGTTLRCRSVVSLTDRTASKRGRIDHHQNRQTDRIVSRTVWNITSKIDRTKRE